MGGTRRPKGGKEQLVLFQEKTGKTEGFSRLSHTPIVETMFKLMETFIWKSTSYQHHSEPK